MFKAVLLQIAATVVTAIIAWALLGTGGGLSAMLGGATVVMPALLFAARTSVRARLIGGASSAESFLLGAFVKLALTLSLMLIISLWYHDLSWPSFLAGLFVTLQSNLFALLVII